MSRVDRRYVDRAGATRERILDAAERLFAEHGVRAVSNRSVAEAAGQGNNTVVGYHFGTKADLVRALIRRHTAEMDARREAMVAALGSAPDVRRWVDCLVGPVAEHLAERGGATWYARFGAQIMTDPGLREIIARESLGSRSLTTVLDGLNAALPTFPPEVRLEPPRHLPASARTSFRGAGEGTGGGAAYPTVILGWSRHRVSSTRWPVSSAMRAE